MPADAGRQVRWLDERELTAWLALGRMLARLPTALDAQLGRAAGLTFFEYQVLAMLSSAPDRTLRMSALADETCASLSRLSHVVTRLETEGLVERRRCGGVGRSTLAMLTTRGMRTLRAAAPGHVETVRTLVLDALSPAQVTALVSIASSVAARLEPEAPR